MFGTWESRNPAVSRNGRFVTFESEAYNLVDGDSLYSWDAFVKDLQTGQMTRVSSDSAGNLANGDSFWPALSGDGRFVAFESNASNLVAGDSNAARDVFVKDRQTAQTTRVSTDSAANPANGVSGVPAVLSDDGRFVVFSSEASNLVAGDSNGTAAGQAKTVRLALTAAPDVASVTSPSGTVQVAPGTPQKPIPVTITVRGNAHKGTVFLQVKVLDAANGDISYGSDEFNIQVIPKPGIAGQYFWGFVALAVLLLIAIILFLRRRRVRRARADVRGLYAILRRNGEQMGPELKAPARWADTFRFVIRDETEENARLAHPKQDDRTFSAARGSNGLVRVVTPEGDGYDIAVGGLGEPLPSGLQLTFRDTRYPSQRSRSAHDAGSARSNGRTRTAELSGADELSRSDELAGNGGPTPTMPNPASASRPSPEIDDDWL